MKPTKISRPKKGMGPMKGNKKAMTTSRTSPAKTLPKSLKAKDRILANSEINSNSPTKNWIGPEKLKNLVHAAFFVSAPVGVRPIKFYDSDYSFNQFNFNWPAIITKAKTFTVYHSDNDPYVSLGNGEKLAKKLGIKLTFIPKAGHLNAESGWTRFDKLFQDIEKILP